ncbi:pyruvate dehydrogenase protein X component-like [Sycon ciliatum]|uniref:pyruvate dehydrogenase protein X component-like n=1 Tax=Sycon ciliatum TaxID=27933 RepID=UPI0020A9F4CC|eukprot:scpid68604/ scgid32554/ Pyruvate dehydrogenase protein X component, mitochondrial; Dihydrolipoamide dehydrogenase-binding protein of pyruvate dehydrogenase complex; Lipoyl-containing pyruvate dehydrogenase complex component X
MSARSILSPAVRYHLTKNSLDAGAITGSGRKGRILKADVLQFLSGGQAVPSSAVKTVGVTAKSPSVSAVAAKPKETIHIPKPIFKDIPNSGMRRTIARRLTESKSTIPHAYMSVECPIDQIIDVRKRLKGEGRSASVNDFIVQAVASALVRVPEANVRWQNEEAVPLPSADVGVAVATDSGLIVPIVFGAHRMNVLEIAETVKALAGKARDRTLQPSEFEGGSISVSNLGMFGITNFTAIINPPQASILAVGTSQLRPNAAGGVQTVVSMSYCFDARAISEKHAADFLNVLRYNLEMPHVPPLL